MGGPAAVIARAHLDFNTGNYRWVAEVMYQVVFADPTNAEARKLAADAFDQLGYLAESAAWRNSYLVAAQEMRRGVSHETRHVPGISPEVLHIMSIGEVFDFLGTRLDGPRAGTAEIVINWRFTDTGESLASTLKHGALTWVAGKTASDAIATVTTTRSVLESVVLGKRTVADAIRNGEISSSGNPKAVADLFALLVDFDPDFPIVEPVGQLQTQ